MGVESSVVRGAIVTDVYRKEEGIGYLGGVEMFIGEDERG